MRTDKHLCCAVIQLFVAFAGYHRRGYGSSGCCADGVLFVVAIAAASVGVVWW